MPNVCGTIRRCAGSSAARRRRRGRIAEPDGRFETRWLTAERNLATLIDLSGRWIDRVHGRRPPRGIVLDMDFSVSPTHGEQEMSVWNGHYACTCYHPLFLFNQFGDLERFSFRPGNVHSADGWQRRARPSRGALSGQVSRLYFRADAAFAMPGVYEYLRNRADQVAIRLPANRVLQERIGICSSARSDVRRTMSAAPRQLQLPGAELGQAAPGDRQGRVDPASCPARRLHRHQPVRARLRGSSPSTISAARRAMDQGRQGRDQVDAAIVPLVRRQRCPAPAPRARLQSR